MGIGSRPRSDIRGDVARPRGRGRLVTALLLGAIIGLGVVPAAGLADEVQGGDADTTADEQLVLVDEQLGAEEVSTSEVPADTDAVPPAATPDESPVTVQTNSVGATNNAWVVLQEGKTSNVVFYTSLSGKIQITLSKPAVIALSYKAYCSSTPSRACIPMLQDSNGNSVNLTATLCDSKSTTHVMPIALPAGDYYINLLGPSSRTTFYVQYDVMDDDVSGYALEYELADKGTTETAIPIESDSEGFMGFLYRPNEYGGTTVDSDYWSFDVDGGSHFTEVYVMGGSNFKIELTDADGNVLHRSLDPSQKRVSAYAIQNFRGYGSSTYGYVLDCGILPAGTYYIHVSESVEVGARNSMYTGFITDVFFTDINSRTAHVNDIEWMALNGISEGWLTADGTHEFRPNAQIARGDMAAFLYRLAGSPSYEAPAASPFKDVTPATSHYKEICWLAESGISTGWRNADGTREFRPNSPIARGDMAAFLYRLAGSSEYTAPDESPFADVTPATSHYKEICWLADTGVSTGWRNADGTRSYRPNSPVARGDMAAFLHRMSDKGLVAEW